MRNTKSWMILLGLWLLLLLLGCRSLGKVSQGRVIDYEPGKGLVTLIQDSNYREPGKPNYDVLPPVTVRIPENSKAMGPAPQAGKLMLLDTRSRKVVIFDAASQSFRTITYTLIEQRDNVTSGDARIAGVRFPVVDRKKKTITAYSARQRRLLTFSVPGEYLTLPDDTWVAGDEVRYYYKDPHQALRLMNVTRTDISRGG